MKNKIFLPAVVFVCAISSSALAISKTQAYDPYYPGSIVNPLQVQIISNPGDSAIQEFNQSQQELRWKMQQDQLRFQQQQNEASQHRAQNQQKKNYLKSQYGISDYYDCYDARKSFCEKDISNPFDEESCLNAIQYCLESKAMSQSRSNQSIQDSSIKKPNVETPTEDPDNFCQTINATWNGGPICECKTGYAWGQRGDSCVPISSVETIKTNNQICESNFGLNSVWYGTMSNAGGLNCTCIIGGYGAYFNKNNTCSTQDDILNEGNPVWTKIISIPPVKSIQQTPIKTKDQICNDFHPNSFFNGTLNDKGALNCDCKSGYEGNDTQTECVAVSVKSSQQTCAENYGANSIWTGETNDKGGPICDCKAGYQWNQGQSSCVVIPKPKITPESSVMKKDSKFSERANQQSSLNSSVSNNDKSGNSSSIFLDKADLIYEDISTTTIERKIPEQKSVWKRVKGFFGF